MAGLGADNGHLLLLLLDNCQWMDHRADSFEVVVWVLLRSLSSIAVKVDGYTIWELHSGLVGSQHARVVLLIEKAR